MQSLPLSSPSLSLWVQCRVTDAGTMSEQITWFTWLIIQWWKKCFLDWTQEPDKKKILRPLKYSVSSKYCSHEREERQIKTALEQEKAKEILEDDLQKELYQVIGDTLFFKFLTNTKCGLIAFSGFRRE